MWKSIVLCVSLFGGAAIGLGVGARFVEPAALPAAAAIGLCLIGVVLILAAPTDEPAPIGSGRTATPASSVENIDLPQPSRPAVAANRTPPLPIEALNS
jgi:hypothetical protein